MALDVLHVCLPAQPSLTYGFRCSLHMGCKSCVEGCPPLLEVGSSELGAAQDTPPAAAAADLTYT
jgi:hypothetical protein